MPVHQGESLNRSISKKGSTDHQGAGLLKPNRNSLNVNTVAKDLMEGWQWHACASIVHCCVHPVTCLQNLMDGDARRQWPNTQSCEDLRSTKRQSYGRLDATVLVHNELQRQEEQVQSYGRKTSTFFMECNILNNLGNCCGFFTY